MITDHLMHGRNRDSVDSDHTRMPSKTRLDPKNSPYEWMIMYLQMIKWLDLSPMSSRWHSYLEKQSTNWNFVMPTCVLITSSMFSESWLASTMHDIWSSTIHNVNAMPQNNRTNKYPNDRLPTAGVIPAVFMPTLQQTLSVAGRVAMVAIGKALIMVPNI